MVKGLVVLRQLASHHVDDEQAGGQVVEDVAAESLGLLGVEGQGAGERRGGVFKLAGGWLLLGHDACSCGWWQKALQQSPACLRALIRAVSIQINEVVLLPVDGLQSPTQNGVIHRYADQAPWGKQVTSCQHVLILVAITVYAVRQCSVEHINHTMPALAEHQ